MTTQKLIMGFVTLIIGIALLGVVATQGSEVVDKDFILNETFDLTDFRLPANYTMMNESHTEDLANAYGSTDWQWNDCSIVVTLLAFPNGTALTVTNDYSVTVNGVVSMVNSSLFYEDAMAPNTTLVTYTHCQDDYISLGWGRSVITMIPGFFALALLMVSIALFYSIAKDTGVI